jgi:hypothetical protein
MWWRVVSPEHLDQNAIKSADRGHVVAQKPIANGVYYAIPFCKRQSFGATTVTQSLQKRTFLQLVHNIKMGATCRAV